MNNDVAKCPTFDTAYAMCANFRVYFRLYRAFLGAYFVLTQANPTPADRLAFTQAVKGLHKFTSEEGTTV